MLIYQVLPRLWGKGRFSDWNTRTFDYLKTLGVTHIWYTGIPRHATGEPFVKGNPGSPYSIENWFDTNPYLADDSSSAMREFSLLVKRTHRAGLKVITDFIPNHVARNCSCGIPVCGYCDYDWTDTLKIDWSDQQTPVRMLEVLRFWAGKGVDGFRCDMVELVPAEAMKSLIEAVRKEFPSLTFIAEVYNRDNYRRFIDNVGFDLLYDKSGAYDSLMSVMNGGDIRSLTWNWQFLGTMQPRMLNFLENHDERRLPAPDYAALSYASLFNNASFMLYFGEEIGENASDTVDGRTSIFNKVKIESVSRLLRYIKNGKGLTVKELGTLEKHREILRTATRVHDWNNYDLLYCNDGLTFPFLRYSESECLLVACNFADHPVSTVISIPEDAKKKCRLESGSISVCVNAHDCAVLPL